MNWRDLWDSLALLMAMVCFHWLMKTIDVVAPVLPLLWQLEKWSLMWDGVSLMLWLLVALVCFVWRVTERMDGQ